ncbi:MAG TPA: hypothetical protein VE269_07890 [Gaiellaceae bacterium]|nr:hypothetical protein [Gaiellaceae bacterium]
MAPTKLDHGLRAVGVVWYREADWPRLRALLADADKLPDTYAEWLASAEGLLAQLRRDGIAAERVPLDPDVFSAWCVARGLAPDAQARSRYASEVVAAERRSRH